MMPPGALQQMFATAVQKNGEPTQPQEDVDRSLYTCELQGDTLVISHRVVGVLLVLPAMTSATTVYSAWYGRRCREWRRGDDFILGLRMGIAIAPLLAPAFGRARLWWRLRRLRAAWQLWRLSRQPIN